MPDIYKHGCENFKKITALFVLQVILGILPVILLLIYIGFDLFKYPVIGYIFIAVILIAAISNITVAKRYNVLLSGFRGEKALMKTVRKLGSEYMVFSNLPIRYKKNRSEIDLLIISPTYLLIIEVKNHSGYISGKHKDDKWIQRKVYKDGKTTETEMQNPLRQMRRQRDIVKSILQANDLDQWIETVLYFSSNSVHLYLDLYDSDNVCSSEKELLQFLRTYNPPRKADPEKLEKIKQLFMEMHEN
ncbi:MAG: NERD domain-containing protein [Ruminiclostridium sp.]|nr:NERD domain-containing protein [Ruminiclostridium sp.]